MEGLLQQTFYCQDVNLSALAQCYFILGEPEEVGFSGSLCHKKTGPSGNFGVLWGTAPFASFKGQIWVQVAKILKELLAREKDAFDAL